MAVLDGAGLSVINCTEKEVNWNLNPSSPRQKKNNTHKTILDDKYRMLRFNLEPINKE